MKKITVLILFALIVQISFAQEEEEKVKEESDINVLFTGKKMKFSGAFINPEFKVSDTYDDYGLLIGGKVGIILNDKFSIGLGGYGLTTKSTFPINQDTSVIMNMGYGGLALEYTLFHKKAVHFSIPVMVGAGGYFINEYEGGENSWEYDTYDQIDNSVAFIVEPGINLELNLLKFLRFSTGVSYRMVLGTSLDNVDITDSQLSNLSYNASFKFGIF